MPLSPPPAVAPAVVWLAQPSAEDIARAGAYAGSRSGKAKMTCYVAADGRLDGCRADAAKSDPYYESAILSLASMYRLDNNVKDTPTTVNVEVAFEKQFDQPPHLLKEPTVGELTNASHGRLSGDIYLSCKVRLSGKLDACQASLSSEHLVKPGPVAAPWISSYQYRPAKRSGETVEAWQTLKVQLSPHQITSADWAKTPGADDFSHYYPELALRSGLSGRAMIGCLVKADGTLRDCIVKSETPVGVGFGNAALAISSKFQMKPEMVDGRVHEDGTVTIPISFKTDASAVNTGRAGGRAGGGNFKLLPWAPWIKAPTATDYAGAFHNGALIAKAEGRVTLMCDLMRNGTLTGCEVNAETPTGLGFDKVAMKLVPLFQTDPAGLKGLDLSYLKVALNFNFSSRTLEAPGEHFVRQPSWVRTIDGADMQAVYPAEAVKAGVFGGQVVVECKIGATGALEGCSAYSETPKALGFGAAAVKVAPLMQANLWTLDGEPTPGQKIRLPMRFIYSGPMGPEPRSDKPPAPPAP